MRDGCPQGRLLKFDLKGLTAKCKTTKNVSYNHKIYLVGLGEVPVNFRVIVALDLETDVGVELGVSGF